jgi:hypothetical protein
MSLPRWATAPTKDAVATEQGWKSPKGELLVSHRGLKSKIDALAPKKAPKKAAKKVEETPETEEE